MARLDGIFDFWKTKADRPQRAGAPSGGDLYTVLEVDPSATQEEIRAAYRRLAARYHPDRNPGDERAYQRFIEIAKANDILSNEDKRERYDRTLRAQRAQEPKEPRSLSTFLQPQRPEAPQEPKGKPKAPPKPSDPWEAFFGPGNDPRGRSTAIYEGLPVSKAARRPTEPPWDVLFPRKVVVDMPSRERLIEGVRKLSLEKIWDYVRKYRVDPRFIESKILVIGPVAGSGQNPVEYDLAELTGVSFDQVAAYAEKKGLERAWEKVLGPLAEQAVLAIESQKPADLPGAFYMDWDPTGQMLELLYAEAKR